MKSFTLTIEKRHAEAAIAVAKVKGSGGDICSFCAVAQAAEEKFRGSGPKMGFTELSFDNPTPARYQCEQHKITWIDTTIMIQQGMEAFTTNGIIFPVTLHFKQLQ